MFENNNISATTIDASNDMKTDILYDGKNDEWLITNFSINSQIFNHETDSNKIMKNSFYQINLAEDDIIL